MSSILKASRFFLFPPPPPPPAAGEQPVLDHRPEHPEIANGEATTAQQQLLPPPLTSTESGPLLPNHQGSSSSSASVPPAISNPEAGGELPAEPPPPPIPEGDAAAQQVLPPPQISVSSTESGLLVPHQGSSSSSTIPAAAEAGGEPLKSTEIGEVGEPIEANTHQQLLPPEITAASPESAALVVAPNDHQGTSSSPLKDSPSVPRACDDIAPLIPVAAEAGGEGTTEANTQQHFGVTSPESGGALVVARNYYHQGPSSSSIPRACVAVAPPPWRPNLSLHLPQWRPNLNLHPMANNLMFEAFQRRANPETQMMMNHMAPPGRVAMAAQRALANNTIVRPNLFLGGFFPVRNPY